MNCTSLCGPSGKPRPRTVHRINCVRCSYDAAAAGFRALRRRRRSAPSSDVAVRSRSGAAHVDGCGAHLARVVADRAGCHRRGARCGPVRPQLLDVASWPYILLGCGYASLAIGLSIVGAQRQRELERALRTGGHIPLRFRTVAVFTVGGVALAVMTVVLVIAQT